MMQNSHPSSQGSTYSYLPFVEYTSRLCDLFHGRGDRPKMETASVERHPLTDNYQIDPLLPALRQAVRERNRTIVCDVRNGIL